MISIRKNAEVRSQRAAEIPEWWAVVPAGERALLHAMARMLRSARRSPWLEVARAAAKWERALGCFIKVRLIGEKQRAERAKAETLKYRKAEKLNY